MTKKEICKQNESIGYWSVCGGVEVKKIIYGIEDYCYCVSNAWYGGEKGNRYHKLKIYYDWDDSYIRLHGYKLSFRDCLRMNV